MSDEQQGNVRGNPCPTPREYIIDDTHEFVAQMKAKMMERRHYGYWQGPPIQFYLSRLMGEIQELHDAIASGNPIDIQDEAVDVANFAMMVYHNSTGKNWRER